MLYALRFALVAALVGAGALGIGAALAHNGGSEQTATRGLGGLSNENHFGVPAGAWTFDVVAMSGKVRNLTLVVKWPCVNGEFYYYRQITKPSLDTLVTTPVIDADGNPATNDDYCTQIGFPGGGNSITVGVFHP